MIKFKAKGDFSKLESFIKHSKEAAKLGNLEKYGREGVAILASVTPVESGETAKSWYYKIERGRGSIKLLFCNSNVQNGVPIAIILQYGHATRNGGWVEGRDYINPAARSIFDKIAKEAWKEVTGR